MNSMRQWRSMASRLRSTASYATSTTPKRKMFSPAANFGDGANTKKPSKAEFVPVYVALGMITVAVALGGHTLWQQLAHSPGVRVRKKMRETVPEVVEPEKVEEEAERFKNKSFFRKVAHVQEFDNGLNRDPTHGDAYAHKPHVETLKSVGVDPKAA